MVRPGQGPRVRTLRNGPMGTGVKLKLPPAAVTKDQQEPHEIVGDH
jgi:hypothetical protein